MARKHGEAITPLYEKVKRNLAEDIRQGRHAVNTLLPPVDELADAAKCSPETMRRALKELSYEGVLKPVQRLGTIVQRAPSLGRVCLLLSSDYHTNLLLQAEVCQALLSTGIDVDVVPQVSEIDAVENWLMRLTREIRPPECLIALSLAPLAHTNPDMVERISNAYTQRVRFEMDLLPQTAPDEDYVVVLDKRYEARLVMDHLLELGHKKIAVFAGHVASASDPLCEERVKLCEGLARRAGAEIYRNYQSNGEAALLKLVRDEGVTAYWDLNDHNALTTLVWLQRAGLRVPQDVSLVGRNDTPWARDSEPPLTTVSVNPEGVAEAIVQAASDALAGEGPVVGIRKVAPRLSVRESTGPARSA